MPPQWTAEWFNEFKLAEYPSFASLLRSLDAFNFKEPQMQGTPAQPETEAAEPQPSAIDAYEAKVSALSDALVDLLDDTTPIDLAERNAELQRRVDNQRASIRTYHAHIEEYQGRILELEQNLDLYDESPMAVKSNPTAESRIGRIVDLQNRLERALHTQKILERDLEESQQALVAAKVAPKVVRLGYGERLVYPCQDVKNDGAWGLVLDPNTDTDDIETVFKKPMVLTDGDVFLQFKTSNDVVRFIRSLIELRDVMADEETGADINP